MLSKTNSAKHVKLSYRVSQTLGLRQTNDSPDFEVAYQRFQFLKNFIKELKQGVETYIVQMEHLDLCGQSIAESLCKVFSSSDDGYKAVIGYKAFQEEGSFGYSNQLREALTTVILGDLIIWQKKTYNLDDSVHRYKTAQKEYDYSKKQVEQIENEISTVKERNKDSFHIRERIKKKTLRLNEAKLNFEVISKECCLALNTAWNNRIPNLNAFLTQLVRFEESFHCHSIMQYLGLSQMLGTTNLSTSSESEAARLSSSIKFSPEMEDIESFLKLDSVKHFEGPLFKKGKMMKTKLYCRLYGSLLHTYEYSDETCSVQNPQCNHRSIFKSPKIYDIMKVEPLGDANIKLKVNGGKEIIMSAQTLEEATLWEDALKNAASWNASTCKAYVTQQKQRVQNFREGIRSRRGNPSLQEVEKNLGVSLALSKSANSPSYQKFSKVQWSRVLNQSFGSFGKETSKKSHRFFSKSLNGKEFEKFIDTTMVTSVPSAPSSIAPEPEEKGVLARLLYKTRKNSLNKDSNDGESLRNNSLQFNSDMMPNEYESKYLNSDVYPSSHSSLRTQSLLQTSNSFQNEMQTQSNSSDSNISFTFTEADPEHIREAFLSLIAYNANNRGGVSLSLIMDWSEIKDLLNEGWITKERLVKLWGVSLEARGPLPLSATALGIKPGELDLTGFTLFVQLMEEMRLETELKASYGVILVDTPALCI